MFTPGRYIVVDDLIEDLKPLVDALNQIGAPCLGIHYDVARPLEPKFFAGVRILFFDLHLMPGQGTTAHARYGHIVQILEKCINPVGGPYIMVLWTSHVEERDNFAAYVERALEDANLRPLTVLGLDKNKYRDVNGGFAGHALRADIEQTIASHVQLQALLSWEADVLAAAGATLATLGDLVPKSERSLEKYPQALDGILSRLAVAAAGQQNVTKDIRGAVNSALAPVLLDRILNQQVNKNASDLWARAVTQTQLDQRSRMDPQLAGRMNRMLHLAMPPPEGIKPTAWGAVVKLSEAEAGDEAMRRRFGLGKAEVLKEFRLKDTDAASCTPFLLRIGAVCDYAQSRIGPIPYVLGFIVPTSLKRSGKAPEAEFERSNPFFELPDQKEPVQLVINARFQVSLVREEVEGWEVLFRIREQFLTMVVAHISAYVTRPGILSL